MVNHRFRCNECNYSTNKKSNLLRHQRLVHPRRVSHGVSSSVKSFGQRRQESTKISLEDFSKPEISPNPELLDQYNVQLHLNNRVLKTNFIDLKLVFTNDSNYPEDIGFGDLVNLLHGVFQNIFAVLTRFLRRHDLIRVVMISEDYLSPPCSLPFLPLSELSAEVCSSAIAAVLNSKNEFSLENFRIHFVSSEQPKPMGGSKQILQKRKIMKIENFYKNKKSVISMPDLGDFLCPGRGLLAGLKFLEGMQQMTKGNNRTQYLSSSRFTQEIINLYRRQNIPSKKRSNLDSLIKLTRDETFKDIQGVNVFSTEEALERVLHVKHTGKLGYINLLQLGNHYHLISSLPEFFGSKGFCHDCGKPYKKFRHFCKGNPNICRYCKNPLCENHTSEKDYQIYLCPECNRQFYNIVSKK